MKKRINWSILFLMTIYWIFSCSVSAEVIDRIVAIVDSEIITLVELNKGTSTYRGKIEAAAYSDDQKQKMIQEINLKVLNALIDTSLTNQEAKKYRISVSDNAIDKAVENMMASKSMSIEELERALNNEGLTLTEYRKNIKKQILRTKLISNVVQSKVVVLDSDIKLYYENHKEDYSGNKKYYLRNILMNKKDKIQEISSQLDDKKDFKGLAKQYSIAPNAKDGGDLGLFDIKNFPDNIKTEIAKLKKGQFSDVITTPQGFQIFYIEDIVLDGEKTYDQAREEIHKVLYSQQAEKKFKTWLESLKQNAHIEIML
ncbi:MAG: SurA N-terminal domain-containing protein [Deltaproteobacteria bacterium]|jgi:peptidyl-prolyl cis-trans isomerase SurA|nr:SurA N-terminal domain-containing protein [Deltaproteobacteria bacterium]